MLNTVRKHPILWTCALIAAASLFAMVFPEHSLGLAPVAFIPLVIACLIAMAVLNFKVFSTRPNASVHRPEANHD